MQLNSIVQRRWWRRVIVAAVCMAILQFPNAPRISAEPTLATFAAGISIIATLVSLLDSHVDPGMELLIQNHQQLRKLHQQAEEFAYASAHIITKAEALPNKINEIVKENLKMNRVTDILGTVARIQEEVAKIKSASLISDPKSKSASLISDPRNLLEKLRGLTRSLFETDSPEHAGVVIMALIYELALTSAMDAPEPGQQITKQVYFDQQITKQVYFDHLIKTSNRLTMIFYTERDIFDSMYREFRALVWDLNTKEDNNCPINGIQYLENSHNKLRELSNNHFDALIQKLTVVRFYHDLFKYVDNAIRSKIFADLRDTHSSWADYDIKSKKRKRKIEVEMEGLRVDLRNLREALRRGSEMEKWGASSPSWYFRCDARRAVEMAEARYMLCFESLRSDLERVREKGHVEYGVNEEQSDRFNRCGIKAMYPLFQTAVKYRKNIRSSSKQSLWRYGYGAATRRQRQIEALEEALDLKPEHPWLPYHFLIGLEEGSDYCTTLLSDIQSDTSYTRVKNECVEDAMFSLVMDTKYPYGRETHKITKFSSLTHPTELLLDQRPQRNKNFCMEPWCTKIPSPYIRYRVSPDILLPSKSDDRRRFDRTIIDLAISQVTSFYFQLITSEDINRFERMASSQLSFYSSHTQAYSDLVQPKLMW